MPTNKMFSVNM